MTRTMRKRITIRPSIGDQRLEDRVVLSSVPTANAAPPIVILTPSVTPPPAAAPVSATAIVKRLRNTLDSEFKDARTDLRHVLDAAIKQLYAHGAKPNAQQKAAYDAKVDGAVDAAALRLSAPVSILPGSATGVVPTIENDLLNGLTSRVAAITQSPQSTVSAQALQTAVNQAANSASTRALTKVTNFLDTAPLSKLSVTSTGASVPLQEYMADQVVSQLERNLAQFAQTFPSAANVITQSSTGSLDPTTSTGTTGSLVTSTTGTTATTGSTTTANIPTLAQELLSQGNGSAASALATIGFVVGSELALFPGSSHLVSQLVGVSPASTTAVTSVPTPVTGLVSSTSPTTTATTALNTGLTNLVTPITAFLDESGPSDLALSGANFSNPFASGTATPANNATFTIGSVNSTFGSEAANAFASSSFSTNFGTGFSTLVNLMETTGLFPAGTSLFTTTTAPGEGSLLTTTIAPGQTSLGVTGGPASGDSLVSVGTNSPGQTTTSVTSGSI
jgi:hypothetical protein